MLNVSADEHDLMLAEAQRVEMALGAYCRDQAFIAAVRDRQARGDSLAL